MSKICSQGLLQNHIKNISENPLKINAKILQNHGNAHKYGDRWRTNKQRGKYKNMAIN